jgi:hypothetical protein
VQSVQQLSPHQPPPLEKKKKKKKKNMSEPQLKKNSHEHLDPRLFRQDNRFHGIYPLCAHRSEAQAMHPTTLLHFEELLREKGLTLHQEFPLHEGLDN